jgi:tripartite-type tricarboxylate transporter receptor subunit TctC
MRGCERASGDKTCAKKDRMVNKAGESEGSRRQSVTISHCRAYYSTPCNLATGRNRLRGETVTRLPARKPSRWHLVTFTIGALTRIIRPGEAALNIASRLAALMAAIALPLGTAVAQDAAASFPNRPIHIIVPFPPGGPTDVDARIIAEQMSQDWNVGIVVENRPGGNTTIGAQVVAKAAPDGYTLLTPMDTTLVLNPASGVPAPYDPFTAFAPITLLANNTALLVVRASDGPKSVKELIARAKASPGKLTYGAGIMTTRLEVIMFAKAAGIEVVLVPYKGSSDVAQGVLNGSVDFAGDGFVTSLPLIQGGQFRALAKFDSRPLPQLPDVPTLARAAELPQLEDISSWIGLVAPAGTPKAVVDKIQQEIVRIYAGPDTAERLKKAGINAVTTTPAEFDRFFHDQAAHWTAFLKEHGISLQ